MNYIYNQRKIRVEWSIYKGSSGELEDFSRAYLKVFIIGPNSRYAVEASVSDMSPNVTIDMPQGLPEGVYLLEAIWGKNWMLDDEKFNPTKRPLHSRDLSHAKTPAIFALTSDPAEENIYSSTGTAVVKVRSNVSTYGYDGLDAYQIAVFRGRFSGSEQEWLDSLGDRELINYYTKGEVDELIDNVEVDLSGYYTKEQTDTKINEAAGGLRDAVEENTDAINDVSQRVSINTQGIADNAGNIAANTDAITGNTEDINQLKSGMTTMGGRVDELETEMDNFVGLNQSNYMGMFPDVNSLPAMTEKGWAWVGSDITAMAVYHWFNSTDGWTRYGSNTYDLTDYTQVAAQLTQIGSKLDKLTALIGDFENSEASDYGDSITEVLEYLLEHGGGGGGTTYSIAYSLGHSTSSSSKTQVLENKRYTTTLTPDANYRIDSIAVSMGGTDITASSVTGFVIDIASVTGDIVITVVTKVISIFADVNWLDTAYGIGDNLHPGYWYNAWAPGCARYDSETGKVIFLQCHAPQHGGGGSYMSSELWAINPYNLWDKELLTTFPRESAANKVPMAFTIDDDGTYYACSNYTRYKSVDHGNTWEASAIANRPSELELYGLQIIDGIMYGGDDTETNRYWISEDYGLTWIQKDFGAAVDAYSETITYSEANFCKFNGSIYAAIRRENANGLLCVLDSNDVWQVISEQLPSNCSDCYMTAIDDTICFAAVNRPDEILTLGRIVIDGTNVTVTSDKTYQFNTGLKFDFHTPTFVYGPDFQMVTFMLGVSYVQYKSANNVAVVGYKDLSRNVMPTYDIIEQPISQSTFLASPYINADGTPPSITNNYIVGNGNQIVNSTIRLCNTHPLQGTNVMVYAPNYVYSNSYNKWDGVEYNGKLYACYVANDMTKTVTTKVMAEAVAISFYDYASRGLTLYNDGETTEFTYPLKISGNLFYNTGLRFIAEMKAPVTSTD